MMKNGKYPPSQQTSDDDDVTQENSKFPVQELRVQSVILQHKVENCSHSFHIGSEMEV